MGGGSSIRLGASAPRYESWMRVACVCLFVCLMGLKHVRVMIQRRGGCSVCCCERRVYLCHEGGPAAGRQLKDLCMRMYVWRRHGNVLLAWIYLPVYAGTHRLRARRGGGGTARAGSESRGSRASRRGLRFGWRGGIQDQKPLYDPDSGTTHDPNEAMDAPSTRCSKSREVRMYFSAMVLIDCWGNDGTTRCTSSCPSSSSASHTQPRPAEVKMLLLLFPLLWLIALQLPPGLCVVRWWWWPKR